MPKKPALISFPSRSTDHLSCSRYLIARSAAVLIRPSITGRARKTLDRYRPSSKDLANYFRAPVPESLMMSFPCATDYSYLSATMGSTSVARRAGM